MDNGYEPGYAYQNTFSHMHHYPPYVPPGAPTRGAVFPDGVPVWRRQNTYKTYTHYKVYLTPTTKFTFLDHTNKTLHTNAYGYAFFVQPTIPTKHTILHMSLRGP